MTDPREELTIYLPDLQATHAVGAVLGRALRGGDVLGLDGPLGAGKTSLVQGLARGLGVDPALPVQSPTFTLLHQHPGRVPLHHADLYRIEQPRELDELGLWELAESGGVLAVEWLSRFPGALGPDWLQIDLAFAAVAGRGGRTLRLRAMGPRSQARLQELQAQVLPQLAVLGLTLSTGDDAQAVAASDEP